MLDHPESPGHVRVTSVGSQDLEFGRVTEGLLTTGVERRGKQSLEARPSRGGRLVLFGGG